MSDAIPFRPGLVLDGRYRLERPLGEGGMGMIWVAHQLALGREVAIKAIKPGRADDRLQLAREARLLAAVHHPSVVQVFDFGRTEAGVSYVVMELLRGRTLEAYLEQVGPLTAEEAVTLALPLLAGLAAVHTAGIVHRDLKPTNILLAVADPRAESTPGAPTLIDFGIARDGYARAETTQGQLVGTPEYMAPEQFAGAPTDARTDLWALAVTLYEMMAGETPFGAPSLLAVMKKVVEDPPPYPRQARGLDGQLWGVLTALLRKDPSDRPASAADVRAQLERWIAARGGPKTKAIPEPAAPAAPAAAVADTDDVRHSTFDALIKRRLSNG